MNSRATGRRIHGLRKRFRREKRCRGYRAFTGSKRGRSLAQVLPLPIFGGGSIFRSNSEAQAAGRFPPETATGAHAVNAISCYISIWCSRSATIFRTKGTQAGPYWLNLSTCTRLLNCNLLVESCSLELVPAEEFCMKTRFAHRSDNYASA
jgi:hypothetical protein